MMLSGPPSSSLSKHAAKRNGKPDKRQLILLVSHVVYPGTQLVLGIGFPSETTANTGIIITAMQVAGSYSKIGTR